MAAQPATHRPEPRASRPHTTGYGIPDDMAGALPWSWASERLEQAVVYWMASVRPDGHAHLMPTWAAWVGGRLYFEGGNQTRRARNIAANPHIAVSIERGNDVVILEGETRDIAPPDESLVPELLSGFEKYRASHDYTADPASWQSPEGGLWELIPRVAFGWSNYPTDATRWQFDE